ncbi:MAG: phosphotransferase, partial [Deferrisomatales bacterium]
MLLETHCHTAEHSRCSHVPAAELVRQVFARGLQGVVFTDHHHLWPAQELAEVRRVAGVPGFFLLLSGQEVRTPELGDVLVYGAPESLPEGTPLADLRRRWPRAALVWAHPYRRGRRPAAPELASPLVDGVEIFSSNHSVLENSRGLRDWHAHKFTALAGTDAHGATYAGTYPTQFDHPFDTIEGLAEELRRGRCRPFFKEIPRAGSQIQVTEIAIGTKGETETRERLIVKVLRDRRKWRSAARAYRVMAAVARRGFDGGPYRVPRPIDRDEGAMTLIEEGLRGRSLFDRVRAADPERAREFVSLAARWLARLHNCRLAVTPAGEFLAAETRRLGAYVARFDRIGHPHAGRARQVMEAVRAAERGRYRGRPGLLVQGHGDYHPKNVYVGQDRLDDRATLYV